MFIEIMKQRTSIRSYKKGKLPADDRKTLEEFLKKQTTGPFNNSVRLELVDVDFAAGESLLKYGMYGLIRGMGTFIAGCVTIGPGDAEDFGYCMEKAVLEATRLGLGTVWLGGFLSRSTFGAKLAKRENEVVPAVTPVGISADKRNRTDQLIRKIVSSTKRKPFKTLFFEGPDLTPLTETAAGVTGVLFDAVRCGPSASNKQPWRLVRDGLKTHFYLDENKTYNTLFKRVRIQGIDMGIAMAHYELASADLQQTGTWRIEPPGFTSPWVYVITWMDEGVG